MAISKFSSIRFLILGIFSVIFSFSEAQNFCHNLDFENSAPGPITGSTQISGWLINDGITLSLPIPPPASYTFAPYFPNGKPVSNLCNLTTCCPMPPLTSEIIDCSLPSGYVDSIIGPQYPVFSIFGTQSASTLALNTYSHLHYAPAGTKVIRLNNKKIGDHSIAVLKRKFTVTANDSAFKYACLLVGQPGHGCCSSTGAVIKFYDVTAPTPVLLSDLSRSVSITTYCGPLEECFYVPGTGQLFTPQTWAPAVYSQWRVQHADLRKYTGKTIEMEVYALDCDAAGHFGYMYFDAECGFTPYIHQYLSVSGQTVSAGDTITINSCLTNPTLTVDGFSATWTMNGGYTTGSSFAPLTSGTINVSFNTTGCKPLTKKLTIFLTVSDSLKISPQNTLLCAGSSLSLTTNATSDILWGNGDTLKSIIVSPPSTSIYTVTGTIGNCTHSAVATVSVTDCSGIKTEKGAMFSIYPNPASRELQITYPEKLRDVVIILENFLGQTQLTESCRQNCKINVAHLPSALYVAKLYAGGRLLYTTKILVKIADY